MADPLYRIQEANNSATKHFARRCSVAEFAGYRITATGKPRVRPCARDVPATVWSNIATPVAGGNTVMLEPRQTKIGPMGWPISLSPPTLLEHFVYSCVYSA